jgi:predicted acylesterase/phospholipase RssA
VTVGLFFTPGAARAAYQVGAAQVLVQEAGIRFDVIAGSSVGALNAAFVATGQVDQLVEEWSRWRNQDVVPVDFKRLARGAVWWSPSLASNEPEKAVITRYLDERRLTPGVRLRINLANLDTGDQELFEWPGSAIGLADAVCASVAVPVAVPPARVLGRQWADGLTVDGFPVEQLVLATGVERAFVVGVAPRTPAPAVSRNPLRILMRALDWNQYSEARIGLQRAEAVNDRVRRWSDLRTAAVAEVEASVPEGAERDRVLAAVARAVDEAGFPVARGPVEVVPILPERETQMFFGDFRPERSRAFIEQGRGDARRALEMSSGVSSLSG